MDIWKPSNDDISTLVSSKISSVAVHYPLEVTTASLNFLIVMHSQHLGKARERSQSCFFTEKVHSDKRNNHIFS